MARRFATGLYALRAPGRFASRPRGNDPSREIAKWIANTNKHARNAACQFTIPGAVLGCSTRNDWNRSSERNEHLARNHHLRRSSCALWIHRRPSSDDRDSHKSAIDARQAAEASGKARANKFPAIVTIPRADRVAGRTRSRSCAAPAGASLRARTRRQRSTGASRPLRGLLAALMAPAAEAALRLTLFLNRNC